MRSSWRMLFITTVACMLGYYDPACKLSFHIVTSAVATAALLSIPIGILPRWLSVPLQLIVGEMIIMMNLVDVYCQIYFLSGITPQLFITVFQSNVREASEFLSTFLDADVLSQWRIVVLLMMIAFPVTYLPAVARALRKVPCHISDRVQSIIRWGACCCVLLSLAVEAIPMYRFIQFFSPQSDAMRTESLIFRHYDEEIHLPPHRILQAWFVTRQSGELIQDIANSTYEATIDSCSHLSPHIVLVIGESYNKHHSSLYGYGLPTTPLQQKRRDEGSLFVFDDVVTPWNITSNVFLNMFSTWNCADTTRMGAYPLFPALFRKAGYQVSFFSNQYVERGFRKTSTNQAGHFFLSNRHLCEEMFDYRNPKAFAFDMRILKAVDKYKRKNHTPAPTLDIIHLIGQHFDYKSRYPRDETHFSLKDIQRPNLNKAAREVVMHYDNATHYNDQVVNNILLMYADKEAIVIYVADHGEEVYDDQKVHGRLFQTPTWSLAHQEFEVPMWIWCSPKYAEQHADIVGQIRSSQHKPMMTDDIPQLLFGIAGLQCQWRDDSRNILSSKYRPKKRIIAGETDYDALKQTQESKE